MKQLQVPWRSRRYLATPERRHVVDRLQQVARIVRLGNDAYRRVPSRPGMVRVRGQEDARGAVLLGECSCQGDAIPVALDVDVDERQLGPVSLRELQCFIRRGRRAERVMAGECSTSLSAQPIRNSSSTIRMTTATAPFRNPTGTRTGGCSTTSNLPQWH